MFPPQPLVAPPPPQATLEFQRAAFMSHYDRQPFLVRHHLADHPLFQLERLVELARRLPASFVEYYAGDVPVSIDWQLTPRNGLSIEETIRRIEECRSWMVLKRVDQDPEYAQILDDCLDAVQPYVEPITPGMYDRAGAIFISSPGSVTPYHLDHEQNFLLQIRGLKQLNVFDPRDRDLLSEEELEEYCAEFSMDRNLVFQQRYQAKAQVFDMGPGDGLHIPATAPHWVKNGPQVSISFSAGFYTRSFDRQIAVHQFNRALRRCGLRPSPYGARPGRDSLKVALMRAWNRGRHWLTPRSRTANQGAMR